MATFSVMNQKTHRTETVKIYATVSQKQSLQGLETCLMFELLSVNDENICIVQPSTPSASKSLTLDVIVANDEDLFEGNGRYAGELHLKTDPAVPHV